MTPVRTCLRWMLGLLLAIPALPGAAQSPWPEVPGTVIDHIPAFTGVYIGSPSLAVLPDGAYVASHDHFGPKTTEHQSALTAVFHSADRGRTWQKISEVEGAFWSSLFVHGGALYLLGPDKHYGNIVIRRSSDGGASWSKPADGSSGVLRDEGEFHCAPMPVVEHAGRLWRAFEWRHPPEAWGIHYRATMLSAPVDADLLQAGSWTLAEPLPSQRDWNGGDMGGWLEGNAVVTPEGELVDILRVQTKSPDEKAAIVRVSADGRRMSFDPATGFVDFPGGAKKFTIRFDPESRRYWSLASIVHQRHRASNPGGIRNTLALTCSADLRKWEVRCILLYHPDVRKHGFQYVDWLFEGEDMIAVCRTAHDDGLGGAHNHHDANFLTFHRVTGFRGLTLADSVPVTGPPGVSHETADFLITGTGFEMAGFDEGGIAFSNRNYVWGDLPERFRGGTYTRTAGGETASMAVSARRDATLHVAATPGPFEKWACADWRKTDLTFHYTDQGRTTLSVFALAMKSGQGIVLPASGWTGAMVILPPDPR